MHEETPLATYTTWLAEADPARFDAFLDVIWNVIRHNAGVSDDLPEDGIGETSGTCWPVGYALDRPLKFAAFRWHQTESVDSTSESQLECFFVQPASTAPQLGLRIRGYGALPAPLPAWWSQILPAPTAPSSGHRFPAFLELVAVLASKGNIATSSAEARDAIIGLEFERDYYKQLSEEQAGTLRRLSARLKDSWRPAEQGQADAEELAALPAESAPDLSELSVWAQENRHRIAIHPRALNAAKKSAYKNPAAIYRALELLAGPYREYRTGQLDKTAFGVALAQAGVQLTGSVGTTTAGERGAAYFIDWKNRKCFLEFHLVKGGGRDERYFFRIYFFWDDSIKQAVVGWLPGHLNNSLS